MVIVRVNSAPALAAAPAAQSAVVGAAVAFTVAATDADSDPLTFSAAAQSTVPVTALSPTGQFSWNTTGAAPGSYQLTYFATDGAAQSAMQTVTITLTPGAAAIRRGRRRRRRRRRWRRTAVAAATAAGRAAGCAVDPPAQTLVRTQYRRPRRSGAPAARPRHPATRRAATVAARLFERHLDPAAHEQRRGQPDRAKVARPRCMSATPRLRRRTGRGSRPTGRDTRRYRVNRRQCRCRSRSEIAMRPYPAASHRGRARTAARR